MTYLPQLAAKADLVGVARAADLDQLAQQVAGKADATTMAQRLGEKADASTVQALAAKVPVPSAMTPRSEAVAASAGVKGLEVSGAEHQHPRLTSTTYGTIGAAGTTTLAFTRSFANQPGVVMTEVGGTGTQPAVFKVESWVQSSGLYTGCVVRAWRAQVMPSLMPVSGLLSAVITGINLLVSALSQYNVFAAPAVGTAFSCVAIQRSDVP